MNKEIEKYRTINKLKTVYRFATAGNRHESSAEHSWGCLILADFFLSQMKADIDRLKVYELLMYHDLVEIEGGDFQMHPDHTHGDKKEIEKKASQLLSNKLPHVLSMKYVTLFNEYEEGKTIEAQFARAIDALEADIHELDYKQDWKGWTKEFLITKKGYLFESFPDMKKVFDELVQFLDSNEYFK